jgi:hypothetical protein
MPGGQSRWSAGEDLSWEPLRIERVCEVEYDHLQGNRFRYATVFVRWRPDKRSADCRYDQLEVTPPAELAEIFGTVPGRPGRTDWPARARPRRTHGPLRETHSAGGTPSVQGSRWARALRTSLSNRKGGAMPHSREQQERQLMSMLSEAFWMHIWMPDPPPDEVRDFGLVSRMYQLAGAIGDAEVRGNVQSVLGRALVAKIGR